MINTGYKKSDAILGYDIFKVIESFGQLDWGGYSPAISKEDVFEEAIKDPHYTVWRWKNPDPKLDKLIVEAVESFDASIEWEIRSRKRALKLGGTNWVLEPKRKREFYEKNKNLDGFQLAKLIKEEAPEIGILSNQDVPKLAEHIKRYIESNR